MVNLKDDIWIKGFDTIEAKNDELRYLCHVSENMLSELIYAGKTSDISEEIAKECVEVTATGLFKNYIRSDEKVQDYGMQPISTTAKESIQSACNREYCIIFKK